MFTARRSPIPQHQAGGHRRAAGFKVAPSARPLTQEERRQRALEEQRARREERINAARNIDSMAFLSLGNEDEDEDDDNEEEEEELENSEKLNGLGSGARKKRVKGTVDGLAQFRDMLQPTDAIGLASPSSSLVHHQGLVARIDPSNPTAVPPPPKGKKKPRKRKRKTKYADVCMFAELLEVQANDGSLCMDSHHGLPHDIETGYVALGPIPVGKRCLAVTYASKTHQVPASSTQLFSRLKGAKLFKFPSPLPTDSILDCILDANWGINGIIHVLDILRWHGNDFMDCEANFRFWWRDSRLSEISPLPPSRACKKPNQQPQHAEGVQMDFDFTSMAQAEREMTLTFEYPHSFLPIPYYNPPISLGMFMNTVIPAAKMKRSFGLKFPITATSDDSMETDGIADGEEVVDGSMEVETEEVVTTSIESDGMLLYVSEACYQSGQTPLSTWVPAKSLGDGPSKSITLDGFEELIQKRLDARDSGR